jgi:hypothetical protein
MVYRITDNLTSYEFDKYANAFLPHRDRVMGMSTDVGVLSSRGLVDNCMNLSCGYYSPHTPNEVVVFPHACQAMWDAYTLLTSPPTGMQAVTRYVRNVQPREYKAVQPAINEMVTGDAITVNRGEILDIDSAETALALAKECGWSLAECVTYGMITEEQYEAATGEKVTGALFERVLQA